MAKTTKTAKPEANKLAPEAKRNIIAATRKTLAEFGKTSTLLVDLAKDIARHAKGKPIGSEDSDEIVLSVSKAEGWKLKGADGKVPQVTRTRQSELRVVLATYDALPECFRAYHAEFGRDPTGWHGTLALARAIRDYRSEHDGKLSAKAVARAAENRVSSSGKAKAAGTAASARKSVTIHMKSILSMKFTSTAFKSRLRELGEEFGYLTPEA